MPAPRNPKSTEQPSVRNIFTMFSLKDVMSLVTTLVALAGAFYAYDKRIAVMETEQKFITQQLTEVRTDFSKLKDQFIEHVRGKEPMLEEVRRDIEKLEANIKEIEKYIYRNKSQ